MTLNIIITPIIITHAQGFETITKFFGEGYLAAPYWEYCEQEHGHNPPAVYAYLQNLIFIVSIHLLPGLNCKY